MRAGRKLILILAGLAAVGVGAWEVVRRGTNPCPVWLAWWLESPLANRLAGTTATLRSIGPRPGQRALEIGPGPGRLLLPVARLVAPGGSATGLELQPAMVERLRQRAERAGITNLTVVPGNAIEPHFAPESFDLVYLCTVLGEISDPAAALRHSHAALAPGGTLSITEIRFDPHYLPLATVQRLAEAAGFRFERVDRALGRCTATFTR